ncbi:MAG: ABC-type transport auxiliary lipoprotein family protein [Alphaproteobacteria bacterium]
MKHRYLTLGLLLFLAGCMGSPPPVPRDHYYRIVVPLPAAQSGETLLPGVVSVAPLDADGLLRERPLLYSLSQNGNEVRQYDYYYWTDSPTRMLQSQMVAYLQRSGLARSVVTPALQVSADYEVKGRIKRFERLLGDGPPRVVAELDLALVALDDSRLVVNGSYAAEIDSADDSMDAAVDALNEALAAILDQFLANAARG